MNDKRIVAAYGRVLVLGIVLVAACTERGREVPPHLIGVWTTDAEKYANRALQITESSVVFHTGPARSDVSGFGIVAIGADRQQGSVTLYTIEYAELGERSSIELLYDEAARTLSLKNQPLLIWVRSDDVLAAKGG
jgi:hypothetical protein